MKLTLRSTHSNKGVRRWCCWFLISNWPVSFNSCTKVPTGVVNVKITQHVVNQTCDTPAVFWEGKRYLKYGIKWEYFRFFPQNVSMCTWCPRQTWTSTESAPCRSHTKTSTCGTYTTLASNWSCGPSARCDDTAETPLGSHLSLEGECAVVKTPVKRPRTLTFAPERHSAPQAPTARRGVCLLTHIPIWL